MSSTVAAVSIPSNSSGWPIDALRPEAEASVRPSDSANCTPASGSAPHSQAWSRYRPSQPCSGALAVTEPVSQMPGPATR